VPLDDCVRGQISNPWFWNPETFVAMRDSTVGVVTVGTLEQIRSPSPSESRPEK
jgi:hypothetical protein